MFCTLVTPGSRSIMPGAVTGSSTVAQEKVCPLVTVSRLVPSLAISLSSPARRRRPRTAAIAPVPIAMPRADGAARSLRVRRLGHQRPLWSPPSRSTPQWRNDDIGPAPETNGASYAGLRECRGVGRPALGTQVQQKLDKRCALRAVGAPGVPLGAFPLVRGCLWSGAGSNRRPSAFQVNRAERCANLRKRTSLTSGTALGGRCKTRR
jgi:hypothetical protein